MKREIDETFLKLHRLGLIRPLARISRSLRSKVLAGAGYNTNLMPGRLVYIDLMTDSLMHSILSETPSFNKCSVEASYMNLDNTFKKYFGYKYMLPVAQGRMAEIVLAKIRSRNAMTVPSNMLFITTRIHQELSGAAVLEIPVKEAYDFTSDFPFKGNIDTKKLTAAISKYKKDWIPYIYVETCVNASGGHPVSMENIKEVSQIARMHNIPVILDACRILENAYLIKERETGYGGKSTSRIVKEFCSYSDGCTMSATKDFFTDTGGFIATNDEKIYYDALDAVMVFGCGLSIRAKARLNDALEKTLRNESKICSRAKKVSYLWDRLNRAGLPVLKPAGGHAVFLDVKDLHGVIPEEGHPEKAFLAYLYEMHGIRASENIMTPQQEKKGFKMLRFAVPPVIYSLAHIEYVARGIVSAWKNKGQIRGLKKLSQPPSLSGSFFAEYEPMKK